MQVRPVLSSIVVVAGLASTGCGPDPAGNGDRGGEVGPLMIFVAASLGEATEEVGEAFRNARSVTRSGETRSVELLYNVAASGSLARQLVAAPRADVFLSASEEWMDVVAESGRIDPGSRRRLLSNALVVVAHPRSDYELSDPNGLADLPFRWLSIGAPASVPAGRYAREWLRSVELDSGETAWARVEKRIAPAHDARAVLVQVEGRRDVVGIAYATDAAASGGRVRVLLRIPPEEGPEIVYSGAVLDSSAAPGPSRDFLAFLSTDPAREIFRRHGFLPPVAPGTPETEPLSGEVVP